MATVTVRGVGEATTSPDEASVTLTIEAIAQKAAVEALRGPQESVGVMLAEYRRRKEFVVNRLRQIPGVTCTDPRGAFYAYPNLSVVIGKNGIGNSLQLSERLLADAHVAVVPGEAFGTDQHIRISYATSMVELERGLDGAPDGLDALPVALGARQSALGGPATVTVHDYGDMAGGRILRRVPGALVHRKGHFPPLRSWASA